MNFCNWDRTTGHPSDLVLSRFVHRLKLASPIGAGLLIFPGKTPFSHVGGELPGFPDVAGYLAAMVRYVVGFIKTDPLPGSPLFQVLNVGVQGVGDFNQGALPLLLFDLPIPPARPPEIGNRRLLQPKSFINFSMANPETVDMEEETDLGKVTEEAGGGVNEGTVPIVHLKTELTFSHIP